MRIIGAVFLLFCVAICNALNVTFDNRAFLLDGQRTLFIGGSIHYPRAHSSEWPNLIQQAKKSGINLIQTYVFWDIHEPKEGEFYFPSDGSNADLVSFIKECQKQDVYVNLRFGPYVCAEWNYGGFPVWLREIDGITYRTMNAQFQTKMVRFVDKTIELVKKANQFANDGGPIVMVQIENEYGNMQKYYPVAGDEYVQWAANYALSKNLQVPWMMCQQGEGNGTPPPASVVNTCNGYYCDDWIEKHVADFPNQPHMWTENWPGWFQMWGESVPHRPAVDVAYAVARWYARGGTFSNYYMAFGGTTFGRHSGGPLIITSYDYDVHINEFGLAAEPKFSLLAQLHATLNAVSGVLLSHDSIPPTVKQSDTCDSVTYESQDLKYGCVSFLSNTGTENACSFTVQGKTFSVPTWSVSVLANACSTSVSQIFGTKTNVGAIQPNNRATENLITFASKDFTFATEPIPNNKAPAVASATPLDQLKQTKDDTDYLWVSSEVAAYATETDVELSGVLGKAGGPVMYAYLNGKLVASTTDINLQDEVFPTDYLMQAMEGVSESRLVRDKEATALRLQRDEKGIPFKLKFKVPASTSSNKLDVLFASVGVQHYGPHLERIQVGLATPLYLNGEALTSYSTVAGLAGESGASKNRNVMHAAQLNKAPLTASVKPQPLTWYSANFATPDNVKEEVLPLAVDLSQTNLVKGQLFVNGFMLGRYWTIHATKSAGACDDAVKCTSGAYAGQYESHRCRTGCGVPSQYLYKLPAGVLNDKNSGMPNVITFLEEVNGTPDQASIALVKMV